MITQRYLACAICSRKSCLLILIIFPIPLLGWSSSNIYEAVLGPNNSSPLAGHTAIITSWNGGTSENGYWIQRTGSNLLLVFKLRVCFLLQLVAFFFFFLVSVFLYVDILGGEKGKLAERYIGVSISLHVNVKAYLILFRIIIFHSIQLTAKLYWCRLFTLKISLREKQTMLRSQLKYQKMWNLHSKVLGLLDCIATRCGSLPIICDPFLFLLSSHICIPFLYTQTESIKASLAGKNVVVATMTSSGKSLCYNLPVLEALSQDLSACAFYLFPTKVIWTICYVFYYIYFWCEITLISI